MDEPQPTDDVYRGLAARLGIDSRRELVNGPVRGPIAGPSDETPLEKLLRLSSQIDQIAAEIRTVRSVTYRAQLWQQWAAIWCSRPEYQAMLKRIGPAGSAAPKPPA